MILQLSVTVLCDSCISKTISEVSLTVSFSGVILELRETPAAPV